VLANNLSDKMSGLLAKLSSTSLLNKEGNIALSITYAKMPDEDPGETLRPNVLLGKRTQRPRTSPKNMQDQPK